MGPVSCSMDGLDPANNNDCDAALSPLREHVVHKDEVCISPDETSSDDVEGSLDNSRIYQCGLLSWRPSCLQPCASLPAFTVVMSAMGLFGSINFSHFTAVISQIEKQYGLSSSVSGFVKNIDNVGFLVAVLIFSHLCRHSNKPRLFAITNIVASLAICCSALPHFIFPPSNPTSDTKFSETPIFYLNTTIPYNISVAPPSDYKYEYCDGIEAKDPAECDTRSLNVGALVILILAGLIQGMVRSPQATLSLTYMDDTSKDASPKYFGFIFGSRSLAPVLGFLLGAWTTTIYVDLSDPGITQTDPRWVGAWWIGFLICGAITIVWSLPLALFPAKIPNRPSKKEEENGGMELEVLPSAECLLEPMENGGVSDVDKTPGQGQGDGPDLSGDFMDNLKDMPRALSRLFRNPIFLLAMLGSCCNVSLIGFITFLSKYIEMQFRQSPSMANIYTGCISAFSFSVGPVVSGRVISKFNINARKSLSLMVYIELISLAGFVGMLLMGCPQADWAGDPFQGDRVNWTMSCNEGCRCDEAEFSPVCGSDKLNYYSPCFAGCSTPDNETEKVFLDCSCIPAGEAVIGRCDPPCVMMIPYLIVLGVTSFATSMFIVPLMTVLLRCVEERDKALSIALGTAFINFAAFPAPIIYGLVVDSTCLVKQETCSGQGACLYNDPTRMRFWIHGLEIGFKLMGLVLFGLALFKSKYATFSGEHQLVAIENDSQVKVDKRLTSTSTISV